MNNDQDFKGKNVLITGGAGFIGSNLAIKLVELEAYVTVIDSLIPEYGGNLFNLDPIKDKVKLNISDVRDEHSMKYLIKEHDYLFNLAGQTSHIDSMNNPYADLEINARSQLSILEACRRYNPEIKIVFASTRQIYGKPQYLPVDEKHPLYPVDVNGINKMAGEWYHLLYYDVYKIRSVVLRLTNTYGPRMRVKDARQTFLGIWIKNVIEGNKILVFGDGKQIRDFNYVDDVVNAILLSAQSEDADGMIFNLGADDPINLEDTAKLMIEISHNANYELVPFPAERKAIDIGDYYADYRKIRSKLGWQPKISLKDGLKLTINYYQEFNKHYCE
ncbi:MAG: NAD-dependent epimerase [Ignavibacteria bacterium RIFOXYB2_FULL_35_12]|nr:MAG: NAD-dependent epimerase [Ignavibacteria bacterium GWF2_35_20]OGU78724.1 MAG: NAD-dependent epimerase [Ignavibacteria bacterium RIFOXYA2_FULL_35_9]OGU88439.1 MAG: NAD-dependent epimerase [Ignavibacteria bacterium RIFOXYA12_FULL_35_25]OGU92474.1 MAG: NAD-dependent epimerase [Ignavibacteria bacterium RIFOXYC12_FULL_35_11]OGU95851.1 MAG: NAD-dependent epimerase [Ignavibacteria bacterium RIFOXYB12_FULL_35_14]OGV00910.1 MAG: NAD-dependent epimerase [Ignavibacteria bacterium RIFOXYC2_FULL_35_